MMKNTKNNKFLDLKFCLTEEMNNIIYLFFNEQKYFYLGNLQNRVPLSELSEYIARH